MMRARWPVLAGLLLALLLPLDVGAGERAHTVRAGDSVSSIAKRYYGTVESAELLLKYNGRTGTLIHPGEQLRVPYCETHRVRKGDTWSALAQRYLGRPSAYRTIATLNGLAPEKALTVGQRIVMPVVLPHRLARGESLATLAERFYGNARLGAELQRFNEIRDPRRLSVGSEIAVPVLSLRLRESVTRRTAPRPTTEVAAKIPAPPNPEPSTAPPPSVPPRFAGELDDARDAFRAGDYVGARELLESLREPVRSSGDKTEQVELWRLLAFVYVALGLEEETCQAYGSLRAISPSVELDPDFVSPKIRQELTACDRRS